jgi:uncharacterized coiled-coil protein SlyX
MNTVPNQPERPEGDLAAAQARIRELEEKLREAEQELDEATDTIAEQQVNFECLRTQIEAADLKIDEATATRRKLEDELENEPCPVTATKAEGTKSAAALQFKPVSPGTLKATDADVATLEALVDKLGWEELMYRLGVIITRQAQEATGPLPAWLDCGDHRSSGATRRYVESWRSRNVFG